MADGSVVVVEDSTGFAIRLGGDSDRAQSSRFGSQGPSSKLSVSAADNYANNPMIGPFSSLIERIQPVTEHYSLQCYVTWECLMWNYPIPQSVTPRRYQRSLTQTQLKLRKCQKVCKKKWITLFRHNGQMKVTNNLDCVLKTVNRKCQAATMFAAKQPDNRDGRKDILECNQPRNEPTQGVPGYNPTSSMRAAHVEDIGSAVVRAYGIGGSLGRLVISGTEDEFQATLVTYTKAGNKTMAMRGLWNAAYEMGRAAAPVRLVVNDAATLWQREKE
ncbi:hypothetical protein C8R43DRAFT_946879 [Mycena crocata]|nr:hypothetical protein C8R43DRAFT_946879 [Mycena crocata]